MSPDTLKKCMPFATDADVERFAAPLSNAMEWYDIDTPVRQAAFLAQVAHESMSLKYVEENLNYSAKRLLQVFPRYFTKFSVDDYAHRPERIANRVYANRYGNGDEKSGDGWKFRGRGAIMCTFKDNYEAVSKELNYDFITAPDDMKLPGPASFSAAFYWHSRGLNSVADQGNFRAITKLVNGGYNGVTDRLAHWLRIKKVLGVDQN